MVNEEVSPISLAALRRGGDILTFSAVTWVVAHAVYAPGRITLPRLQGAIVMYLNFASIFAAVYGLIWELSPAAFANLVVQGGGPEEIGSMLYFSFTTLTTTGHGDIVAVDPFASVARSVQRAPDRSLRAARGKQARDGAVDLWMRSSRSSRSRPVLLPSLSAAERDAQRDQLSRDRPAIPPAYRALRSNKKPRSDAGRAAAGRANPDLGCAAARTEPIRMR